jgi:uncharacterized membrane protein
LLPDPLHPIVVHFPIVLSILLPLVAAGALFAVSRGARPIRAWGITIAVAAALTLSAWVATETGEQQEERVEDVVGETRLDAHASAGESLFYASIGVLALLAVGIAPGNAGRVARYVGAVGTLTVAAASFKVGTTGGDLVYKYDAASAYAKPDTTAADTAGAKREGGEKGEKGEKEGNEKDEK